MAEVLAGRTRHDLMPPVPEPAAIRLHADVAEAVRAGNAAATETAMRAILDEAAVAIQPVTDPSCRTARPGDDGHDQRLGSDRRRI